jgi:2'-5' RNA ligase
MKSMRLFIALEIPMDIKQEIISVINKYQRLVPSGLVKWVSGNNLHITLKFLGDTLLPAIPGIQQKMDDFCSVISPFNFTIAAAGMFPSARKPKVIWLGLDDKITLAGLSTGLDKRLASINIPKEERPFSPHLTIGRVYQGLTENSLTGVGEILLRNQPGLIGNVHVNSLSLLRSDLRPDGPVYSIQHQSKLSTNE